VSWIQTNGRWQCFNAGTDTIHWDTCSAERFRKIQETGRAFSTPPADGYITPLKRSGVQFTRLSAQEIIGKDYQTSGACRNCVPPWEKCPNGCQDEIA
jgi:hypothetical protein